MGHLLLTGFLLATGFDLGALGGGFLGWHWKGRMVNKCGTGVVQGILLFTYILDTVR